MSPQEQEWADLRTTWSGYTDAIDAWLGSADREDADHAQVDELIHGVIHAHNDWSQQLSHMIDATHHH